MKKKLVDMVEEILRNKPDTRNSDIELMIEIWKRYYPQRIQTAYHHTIDNRGPQGAREFIYIDDLFQVPRHDAIKRIRATFNHEGKYFPTDWNVARQRGLQEDAWRLALGYPAKADTVKPSKDDSYMDPERDFNSRLPL
jgi:hypothetical protein